MSNNLSAKFLNINTIQLCVNHSLRDFINHIEILCNDEKIETSELQKKESKDNFDIFIVHVQSFLFGGSYKIKIQDIIILKFLIHLYISNISLVYWEVF